jgi:hypothetical protein
MGPHPPPDLRLGIEAVKQMDGVDVLDSVTYDDASSSWVIHLRLTIAASSAFVPTITDWYVLVDPAYPLGYVNFHPAEQGGLRSSFRHMQWNDSTGGLWRSGVPCLDRPGRWLGSLEFAGQPNSALGRLRFHTKVALQWLDLAARGALTDADEPFELPRFTDESDPSVVGFDESRDRYARWQSLLGRAGRCTIRRVCDSAFALDSLLVRGEAVLPSRWGARISQIEDTLPAFWISLPRLPVVAPWDVPKTWGQLRGFAQEMRVDFDTLLKWVYHKIHEARLNGGQCLFIGFPIPDVCDGESVQMHWQPLALPAPVTGDVLKHARPGSQGAWPFQLARTLSDEKALQWLPSENWSEERLRVRGSLDDALRTSRIVLIGAGALGCALAEMLVREGVNDLLILDFDKLEMGNLRRHVLTIEEIGVSKSAALAARLNSVSPFARVRFGGLYPQSAEEQDALLENADVVIDCTANEDVIGHLSRWRGDGRQRWFFVGSFGVDARRLFLYTERGDRPDAARYKSEMRIPIREERAIVEERGLSAMHGAGCWNPVFPARWSDVQSLAAEMLHAMERVVLEGAAPAPQLDIIWLRTA